MTTFADVLRRLLRREPGRPLVTFYDEATGERVELSVDDVRQLGGQGRLACWSRSTGSSAATRCARPAGALAGAGLPRRRLDRRASSCVDRAPEPDAVVCGPGRPRRLGAARGRECRCWPARCCRWGCASPSRCRPGVHDVGVEIWSQPDAFIAGDPPEPATTPPSTRRTRRHAGRAVERGRRRESAHRRRPAPVGGEPGFPTGTRRLHGAAGARRLAGRWSSTPARSVSRRRAAERATARFPACRRLARPGRRPASPPRGSAARREPRSARQRGRAGRCRHAHDHVGAAVPVDVADRAPASRTP